MMIIPRRILIATPMMPPTPGGPATHAKKLFEHFSTPGEAGGNKARLFNFEKYNKYPAGVRHLLFFFKIFQLAINTKIIFALDGFSVAMPSVLVGKILRVPVVLRIGGDLVHEQLVEKGEMIPMNEFYENFDSWKKKLPRSLKFKLYLHKLVIENADAIIFNTDWQRKMYNKAYKLPKKIFVLINPINPEKLQIFKSLVSNESIEKKEYILTSITRDVPFKNQKLIREIVSEINDEGSLPKKIFFDTKNGGWENCMERIARSDLYISCAISDVAPNQLLEAITLGIPAIVTNNTGYFDLLKNVNGVKFVEPKNKQEIKNAILQSLSPEENISMRKSLKELTWDMTWEKYFTEYEKIIKEI